MLAMSWQMVHLFSSPGTDFTFCADQAQPLQEALGEHGWVLPLAGGAALPAVTLSWLGATPLVRELGGPSDGELGGKSDGASDGEPVCRTGRQHRGQSEPPPGLRKRAPMRFTPEVEKTPAWHERRRRNNSASRLSRLRRRMRSGLGVHEKASLRLLYRDLSREHQALLRAQKRAR